MKKNILLFIFIMLVGSFSFYVYKAHNIEKEVLQDITVEDIERLFSKNISSDNSKQLLENRDLIPDKTDTTTIRNNTINLQKAIDDVSNAGGGNIYLPAGTYYFSKGGVSAQGESYVIRCRNNVSIIGAGTNENDRSKLTVLKPYYNNPNSTGGLDMFYFNNYADTNFNQYYSYPTLTQTRDVTYHDINGTLQTLTNQTVYLINADFSNFVIDAKDNLGGTYTTSGKGFMINLFANCDWNNVVVKNTDGSGFGMDCPINSTIKNSVAINCGKKAEITNGGASGFGIGTGISDLESIIIENCVAIGNKKFGFFFEDQARFNPDAYKATKSLGFVVTNSQAGGNLYDFGGLKAYDVTYQYVKSISGLGTYTYYNQRYDLTRNKGAFNFSLYSVNSQFINSDFTSYINDVSNYNEQVAWALNNGYIPVETSTTFAPNKKITREEAITYLYSYSSLKGDVIVRTTDNDQIETLNAIKSRGGFGDVTIRDKRLENDYNDAILWGIDNGILSRDTKFRGNDECSRAEFFTMLYRLAGSPRVDGTVPFTDIETGSWYYNAVVWAYQNQITNGKSSTSFAPSDKITKVEVSIALFRYNRLNSRTYNIKYNYIGGNASNRQTYTPSDSPFVLNNPTKTGYTFIGWTGSNGSTPSRYVTIPTGSTGDLVYTANWEVNLDYISIKTNPTITTYHVGDTFNADGLTIEVIYGDRTSKIITEGFTLSSVDLSTPGTKTVTVNYEGKTTSFNIDVQGSTETELTKIDIKSLPNKVTYNVLDSFDATGLTIEATYSDNSKRIITDGYELSPVNLSTPGTKIVTVKYNGKTTDFNITVLSNNEPIVLRKIDIETFPTKLEYFINDTLSTTGLTLRATYSDGSSRVITNGFTVNNVNLTTKGTKTVTVNYEGKSTTYQITVKELQVAEISIINLPERLVYYVGDTFSSTGLVLSVKYSNGDTTEVKENYETSIAPNSKLTLLGETRVTVTYGSKKTYYTINVVNTNAESMIISRYPYKTEYFVGEILDLSGLELKKVDSLGNVEIITSGYTSSIPNKTTLTESGTKRIVITYEGYTFNVDIKVLSIESLTIKNNTLQTSYKVGDTFNTDDIVLIANCSNGTQREITTGYTSSIPEQYVFDNSGTKELSLSYGNKKVTTSLKVVKDIKLNEDYMIIGLVGLLIIILSVLFKKEGIIQIIK